MRFLVFTTLYPNAEMPAHGVFVENRLRAFLKRHDAEARVIAPAPWFPFHYETFGKYARWARVPKRETRHGVEIFHPRYFIPPKIGIGYAPHALTRCFRKAIADVTSDGWDFDFIDAHYFYPDGVAATAIAAETGKPLAITARGSDITQIANHSGPREHIVKAAMRADAVITVAEALKDELGALGAPPQKITVLRNGVDLEVFAPGNRDAIRNEMALSGKVIVSAGHLIDRKGHDLVIDALNDIPDAMLLIAGGGEKRDALERRANAAGLGDRVRFLGEQAPENMPALYNAADLLVLASSREGWPNVLLEAMACGAPCVATNVGGNREVIRDPAAGRLAGACTAEAIAAAIKNLLAAPPDRAATRAYAAQHSWGETADGMAAIFTDLAAKARAAAALNTTPLRIADKDYRPKLIVTVDTEEEFDWSDFDAGAHRISDMADIDRFQAICAEAGAKPLYLLTYPLLKNQKTASYFRTLKAQGAADCGLHLHQWVTPPETDFSGAYFSFQNNLPRAVHLEKLSALAEAFKAAFGERAIAHRAGRYGISPADYDLLRAIGVTYDFSPSAGFDFTNAGGPDFSGISNHPFSLSGAGQSICVTPVSGAQALRGTRMFSSQEANAPGFAPPRAGRLAFTIPMRLSPEGAGLADLKALTKRLVADKTPIITFTLHSTSLTTGANPYVKDAADVARILDVTRSYLAWFRENAGGEIISLGRLADLYETAARSPRD